MHADLTDDLQDILQVFRRLNLDVIVVDQTTPEINTKRTVLRESADSGDAADDIRTSSYPRNRAGEGAPGTNGTRVYETTADT